jgi:serine/threonine protein kinase
VQSLKADDPRSVGGYALVARLGRGGMGTVYLGRSRGGRLVAVKLISAEHSDDPGFRERFRREVEMARSVGGFWTAAVVDADHRAERPWLATEYVPGPTLQQAVTTHGPLPELAVRRLAAGLAEALAAIHATGLVHRDLKPSNVLLGADGPRVIDFGISQARERTALTATGSFFGTPGYSAPEQVVGGEVGPHTDVFALGAVSVFAATGCGPYGDGEPQALLYRVANGEPDLDRVPAALRELLAACLSRDPARRPAPAQVLTRLGDGEAAPPTSAVWLPKPVQTLVQRYHTELHERGMLGAEDPGSTSAAPGGPAAGVVQAAAGKPPTRVYTEERAQPSAPAHQPSSIRQPPPAAPLRSAPPAWSGQPAPSFPQPPYRSAPTNGQAQPSGGQQASGTQGSPPARQGSPAGAGTRFGTSRAHNVFWGGASLVAALICAGIADQHSAAGPAGRLVAAVAFVVLIVAAGRHALHALRPQLGMRVSTEGLVVSRGGREQRLPWSAVSRARVVDDRARPWLVVWLAEGAATPAPMGGGVFQRYHGGLRVIPVAHDRRRERRAREVRELRAALAWYAPRVYDSA